MSHQPSNDNEEYSAPSAWVDTRKIIMYVTAKDGEGHTMKVGEYDDITDVVIHTNMFSNNVEISFEYDNK